MENYRDFEEFVGISPINRGEMKHDTYIDTNCAMMKPKRWHDQTVDTRSIEDRLSLVCDSEILFPAIGDGANFFHAQRMSE